LSWPCARSADGCPRRTSPRRTACRSRRRRCTNSASCCAERRREPRALAGLLGSNSEDGCQPSSARGGRYACRRPPPGGAYRAATVAERIQNGSGGSTR
jgi:hypothetical protein